MGNAIAFDTLAYSKRLKKAGFTDEQAEVQAEAMAELIDERLATKEDVKNSELALKENVKNSELALRRDMKEMELTFDLRLRELEMRLTIRLGVMMVASIAIVAVLVKPL